MNFKNRFRTAVWAVAVVIIIGTGIIYMPLEKDRPAFWEALYSTLRLFVFERDLPAFPSAWQLIVIYFAAPLVTLSALGKLIWYLFRITPSLRTRWMRGHVVVCGAGRLGMLIAASLKKNRIPVVAIDSGWSEEMEEWSHRNGIPAIYGDFRLQPVHRKAGSCRARALIFTTGDDLLNIDGAFNAYEACRGDGGVVRLIWTHIADDWLTETMRRAVETEGKLGIRFFDTYDIAARGVARESAARIPMERITRAVIIGYGKFGSDIFEALAAELKGKDATEFVIMDRRDLEAQVKKQAVHLGLINRTTFIMGDIRHTAAPRDGSPAYFICTDNDLGNLSLALTLSLEGKGDPIFVRMGHWPLQSVSEHLGSESGIVFMNINDLIARGLCDIGGIITPATEKDLKRVRKRSSQIHG